MNGFQNQRWRIFAAQIHKHSSTAQFYKKAVFSDSFRKII